LTAINVVIHAGYYDNALFKTEHISNMNPDSNGYIWLLMVSPAKRTLIILTPYTL